MEIGQQIIYKAVITLGRLRFVAIKTEEIASNDFCIKLLKTDQNFEYGTHGFYQLEILTKGKHSDINLNNITISSFINFNTTYYSSYNETNDYFILEGLQYNREPLKLQYYLPQKLSHEKVVYYIVYALLLLKKYQNIEKVNRIWNFLFITKNIPIGQSIDLINEFNDSFAEIVNEYPFMSEVIKSALDNRIEAIKQQLEELTFLKNS